MPLEAFSPDRDLTWALDPVAFAEDRLGFRPDQWRGELLRSTSRQIIENVTRQGGKPQRNLRALEDWWKRIEALVAQGDTIVFILSPDAVASDVCRSEVRFADSL